jgi:hypothetical protein
MREFKNSITGDDKHDSLETRLEPPVELEERSREHAA